MFVVPRGTVSAVHRSIGRTGRVRPRCLVAAGPVVRSVAWCRAPGQLGPTSLPLLGPPRSGKSLPGRASIGRVAASRGGSGAAGGLGWQSGRHQRCGGAAVARTCRGRWTRQQRLPSSGPAGGLFSTTGIATERPLTPVSTRKTLLTARRADNVGRLNGSCIAGQTTANEEAPQRANARGHGRIRSI